MQCKQKDRNSKKVAKKKMLEIKIVTEIKNAFDKLPSKVSEGRIAELEYITIVYSFHKTEKAN